MKTFKLIAFFIAASLCLPCYALVSVRDAETEAVITELAKPIFSTSGLSTNLHINLLQDNEINAFVLDGKNVFMNTGLIIFSNNPEAISGVLAHECTHIKDGHVLSMGEKSKQLSKASILSTIIGIAGIASGAGELGAATIVGSQEAAMRSMIGHIRGHEHAADIGAYKILKTLNISNSGLIKLSQALDKEGKLKGYGAVPLYLRTHPPSRERADFLMRHPTFDHNKPDGLSSSIRSKFAMVSAKLYAFTQSQADTRRQYTGNSDADLYAQSIALFRSHKLNEAILKLDILLHKQPNNPYLYELKGQFYLENGKVQDAITYYSKANALAPKATLIQLQLAISLINASNPDNLRKAINLLQSVANHEPSNAFVWHQLSIAYGKNNNQFAYQVALAKKSDLLQDNFNKDRFLKRAKNLFSSAIKTDKFITQAYYDLNSKQPS